MSTTTDEGRDDDLRRTLEAAAEDLWYSSEADHRFDWVRFDDPPAHLTPDTFAALAERAGEPAREVTLERFLRPHLEPDPADEAAVALVPRYRALADALREGVGGVRVFRVGEVHIHVYAVGTAPSGALAGLHTQALET